MNKLREKTTATLLIAIFMISMMAFAVSAKPKKDYNTITEGEVLYSAGHYLTGSIPTGFDIFGYNYQGRMFKGSYYNSYAGGYGYPVWEGDDAAYFQRLVDEGYATSVEDAETLMDTVWCFPHREVKLTMKWSDTWLSNVDRNLDGKLDRGDAEPYDDSAAPGAWLTNHQFGENDDGTNWNYFVKIVYAPSDWHADAGIWYDADNVEMGTVIWGSYARILQVSNDPYYDEHGCIYNPSSPTGFGYYNP